MIKRYTYRFRILFTLVLLAALCANFSEELKEKEVQEKNEKVEYVYTHRDACEFEKTFINTDSGRWFLDFYNARLVSVFLSIDNRLFIKFCQLIHYN